MSCLALLGTGIAEEALDALATRLRDPKKEERREAVYQLQKLGADAAALVPQLIEALADEDDQVWHGATMSLAAIGPAAAAAIPELMEQMGGGRARYTEQRRHRSAFALSRIGAAAIPSLLEALEDDHVHRRWGALHAFGLMGEEAAAWIPRLVVLLGDQEETVRQEAQATLAMVGPGVLGPVAAQLKAEEDERREGAARVLGRLGDVAVEVRGQLLEALVREEVPRVRAALMEAAASLEADPQLLAPILIDALLGEAGEQDAAFNAVLVYPGLAEEMVPKLVLLLESEGSDRRELAARMLGRLGESALPAADRLIGALQAQAERGEPASPAYIEALVLMGSGMLSPAFAALEAVDPATVRRDHWMIRVLRDMGPLAVDGLESRLEDAVASVACVILQALPEYRRRQPALERRVLALLDHEHFHVRAQAVTFLQRLPLPEKIWVAAERRALEDPAPDVRAAALAALNAVPLDPDERLRILEETLNADETEVRLAAVRQLGELGEGATPLVSELLALARGPSAEAGLRLSVIQTLGKIGAGAAPAVPFLLELLKSESDAALRVEVLQTLGAIGEPARDSLPLISQFIAEGDEDLKRAALAAFAGIETDRDQLITVYLQALDDPSAEVRYPVIVGLGKLGRDGREAAPRLVDLLASDADGEAALEALREIRPRDVALCVRMLKSESPGARLLACDRLAQLKATEAIPDLREALKDDYGFIRRRAREAIEQIEKE